MALYVGTKIVRADIAIKDGQPGYRIIYPDGYESWSPKRVFEEAYRLLTYDETSLIRTPLPEIEHGVTASVEIKSPTYQKIESIIEDLVPAFTDAHREDMNETKRSVMHRFYQRLVEAGIVKPL